MPVKINGNILKNIQVHYREAAVEKIGVVEKVGVAGSPVFLKGDGGTSTTTTKYFGDLLNTEFSTDYGVWDFELSLWGFNQGAGIPDFDFTISVRIETATIENARTFDINIRGTSLSNAEVNIRSYTSGGSEDISGTKNADFASETSVLNLTPVNEGNGLRMRFLDGDYEYPGFIYDPNINWYNKDYPKYVVSVSGNPGSLYSFTFYIVNQRIELTH